MRKHLAILLLFCAMSCTAQDKYDWKQAAVNAAASFAIDAAVTYSLKPMVRSERPDGSDNHSFPSGHTSLAFTGASVLFKETRHISPWIGIAGYAAATGIAIERVANRHHHWADVLAGAGIGILSTEAGYWLGRKITGKRRKYDVAIGSNAVSVVLLV